MTSNRNNRASPDRPHPAKSAVEKTAASRRGVLLLLNAVAPLLLQLRPERAACSSLIIEASRSQGRKRSRDQRLFRYHILRQGTYSNILCEVKSSTSLSFSIHLNSVKRSKNMSATKKYTLYSSAGDDRSGPKPCAFFASPAGCRNGDKCKFSHGAVSKPSPAAAKIPESSDRSSVVSSESESPPPPPKKRKQKKKQQQQKQEAAAVVVAAAPAPVPAQVEAPPAPAQQAQDNNSAKKAKKEKKRKSTTPVAVNENSISNNPFAMPKQAASATAVATNASAINAPKQAQAVERSPKAKKAKRETTPKAEANGANNRPSFLGLSLPIAPFAVPEKKADTAEAAAKSDDDAPQHQPVPPNVGPPHQHPPLPLPKSTPEGRQWTKAILATRAHVKYETSFDFTRLKESEPEGTVESWIKPKPYGAWCANNPPAIAIDCEMCETRDPVTGTTDAKALCRISIVNAVNPEEVLLDTLVKPVWPIVDYRTRINGIEASHLESVQFTLRHAQAFMMALCSEETVIAGHALHNDLAALKMEHNCNVDSACLFTVKDEPGATPSLRDLAMAVLGKPMPSTHDSVNDARTALLCLKSYLEKDGKVEPIARSYPKRKRSGNGGGGADHLLVHRIPKFCKPEHITQMLLAHTFIQPKEVGDIEFGSSGTGKLHVYFASPEHATLAFETLSGEEKPEKSGRSQKKVYLRNGDYVQVRSSTKKAS